VRRLFVAGPLVGGLVLLAACEHARPFAPGAPEPNVPFTTDLPRQLTFSAGLTRDPSWFPDGSALVYSFELPQPDRDRCLGVLPAPGGHLTQAICPVPSRLDRDSTTVLSNPAVSTDRRLAYLREGSLVGAQLPSTRELIVASLARPDSQRVVLSFPYTAPDGRLHEGLSHLHWLDAGRLVFLALQIAYPSPPNPPDTVVTPVEVAILDVSGGGPVTVVPNTVGATSVNVSNRGTLVVTMQGDAVVYEVQASSGLRTPLFDFDTLGAVVDAQVAGTTVLAVGRGLTVRLGAGQLYAADLATGGVRALTTWIFAYYQRPALDPSGARVAAEQHAVTYVGAEGGPPDTLLARPAHLWLVPL